jgi:hypothetical protein
MKLNDVVRVDYMKGCTKIKYNYVVRLQAFSLHSGSVSWFIVTRSHTIYILFKTSMTASVVSWLLT